MATAAVIGLSAGKRLLRSSFYYSDLTEKLSCGNDFGLAHHQVTSTKNLITAKKSSSNSTSFLSNRHTRSMKALKGHADIASDSSTAEVSLQRLNHLEEERPQLEFSVEALLLLQKSMLEKQWNLSPETVITDGKGENSHKKIQVIGSGTSARRRRIDSRMKGLSRKRPMMQLSKSNEPRSIINPDLLQDRLKGYVKGVINEEILAHSEVVQLSKIIKTGLYFEEQKSRLKERLGCEPSEEQLATSLRISRTELHSKLIECSLAREKLAMSNVRLVMSIAQRYDNMGAEMADLIQGGLIGLLRGIEKFDSSKGFKISTYVYWWIRQGVSRALVENSRTLRLPTHLHERLSLIRNAKTKLEEKGLTPSIDRIAAYLNMSQKKVKNATEAISKVFSIDRDAFPSLNGLPGETLHSYIADIRPENIPWHGVYECALKDEVNKLISTTLRERERDIVRLYYGLDNECLTWEDISRRIGLSRERVRQVGLVALEKLKHAARKRSLEAMLLKQH
ncbi:RNA polymerase sigma factor sigA [Actinidia eriantha]|uniref:RNA polymerase sigma factor sigA n=1 Tax=Actinidia eriantha TaxID=165200 RepID=UPI002589488B|nr:RNA polymerase sigma factor sigA [Actinidia eriantha]XP_057478809.1 RNA polymerase sigma factor sigA [Actinidia eriantha]XP_057478812.1 RNA polymerase sigma factor sigA [Actinidia eriantha]XP_057478817.1 RNA polymerase sigma factor sigA [Actinidia eriantha]